MYKKVKQSRLKEYIMFSLVVVLVFAGITYYYMKDEDPVQRHTSEKEKKLMTFSENTIYAEDDSGKRLWEITAKEMVADQDTKETVMQGVTAVIYKGNGGKINVRAPEGTANVEKKDMNLKGGVYAEDSDGNKLVASDLNWQGQQKKGEAKGNVKLLRQDTLATADALVTDNNLDEMKLTGNVKIIRGGKEVEDEAKNIK